MANSNNWGEIYKSTWWGDKAWSANTLFIDSAPPGFGLNLLKASEDMDNTRDWLRKTGATVSGDNTNDPNGELTAERVDFVADQYSRIQQLVTLEASTTYTFSVHARVPSGQPSQDFRLRVFGVSGATGSFTALSSGWTRFDFDFITTTAGTHTLAIMNDADGEARSIQFWGAMLNEGADVGGYVKTDASVGGSSPSAEYTGFGDEFAGVTAYYSLRQFTEAETLNAIRVRRSSDDTEQDIGFDANGDLDTTALLAFVGTGGTDNGFVTTFYDQSGNGNDATNATSTEQPLVVSGGTLVTENGKAAIDFDGVDDNFDISNFTSVPTISQFNVLKPSATNVDETFTSIQNATTTDGIFLGQGNLGTEAKFGLRNFQGSDVADSGIAMTLQQYLLLGITTSTTAQIYANGVAGAISARARGDVLGDSQIGANGASGNNFSGKFQELIIFDSDQSTNRTGIETNINDHFSIYP